MARQTKQLEIMILQLYHCYKAFPHLWEDFKTEPNLVGEINHSFKLRTRGNVNVMLATSDWGPSQIPNVINKKKSNKQSQTFFQLLQLYSTCVEQVQSRES